MEKNGIVLQVEKLSALLRRITSKHHGGFYGLNCLHSFSTEKNLNCIKVYEKIKILYCNLSFFVIYADLEWIIEKIDGCKSNPENSSTTEILHLKE